MQKRWLGIRYCTLDMMVQSEDGAQKLWVKEARDLARGFGGALFVALPLLYTEEMWNRARTIPTWMLLLALAVAYLANVGYILFEGYKPEPERKSAWADALVALALGGLAALLTLSLTARFTPDVPLATMAKLVLLEAIPAGIGASLAVNVLGARQGDENRRQPADQFHPDVRKGLATLLGALFFAFNIAPTVEPRMITLSLNGWNLVALVVCSLFVSYIVVFLADFVDRDNQNGLLRGAYLETVIAYALSLLISAALLWLFGYLTPQTPFSFILANTLTLGYVTTLGGAAGRLIL